MFKGSDGREIYRTIKISGKETLDRLCEYILDTFDFIHEHLYEFCMDNRMYSEDSYQYDPEDGGPSTDIAIDKIGLVKGQNFRYTMTMVMTGCSRYMFRKLRMSRERQILS